MRIIRIFRKNYLAFIFLLIMALLVIFSNTTFSAAKTGLSLWANKVVPSLFPFLVSVELLGNTNVAFYISILLDKYMKPLFNLPGISAYPLIMGFLSGYPIGAKIVSDLFNKGLLTKDEAERMLPFTNNSGPLFLIGTVGIGLYSNSFIGIILLFTHILSSLTVGIIIGFYSRISLKKRTSKTQSNKIKFANSSKNIQLNQLGEILGVSILNGIKTVLLIGGFVTFFSVLIAIMEQTKIISLFSNLLSSIIKIDSNIVSSVIFGLIELTNGLNKLSLIHLKSISVNIILSAFIIGFGSFSVLLQVFSIISKYNLSIKKYLQGKLLQGFIAGFYTYLILLIPFFNYNL